MKRTILCIVTVMALVAIPFKGMADTMTVHYLILNHSDGTEAKFALTDFPVISFSSDNKMIVTCNGEEITFDVDALQTHEIISEEVDIPTPTGISNIGNEDNSSRPSFSQGEATFSGLKEGQRIMVVSIDGKVVTNVQAGANGKVEIDLNNLPKGVYILRAPNYSVKVLNK